MARAAQEARRRRLDGPGCLMPELPSDLRPPFTSSGLNTLLKEASGIRRMGEGAAEMAEKLGTLLMAKAAAQAGEKARAARRTR